MTAEPTTTDPGTIGERTEYRVAGLPTPVSHYTDAVRWGDLLFVSGCAAIGTDGAVVAPGDVAAQARVVHEYLGAALRAAGTDFAHVLKVTVYLLDVADRAAVDEVRREFFGDARPASTLVEVSSLVLSGLLVEVEAIAGIPS
jgi:enamine deaminase RidA (YjgF/YER057c/UK114 family)